MARGKNLANPDCILSGPGRFGSITVPVIAVDYGISITATEDMGRDQRIFYPMQAQKDMFSISAIFASKEIKGGVQGANDFNAWIRRYVEYASSPGSNIALGMRVQVPVRRFDMTGFPVQGWSYTWAPVTLEDVSWVVTINFDGASQTGAIPKVPKVSTYAPPPEPDISTKTSDLIDQLMFYPAYYDPGNPQYTGNPSDAIYRKQK
jgi:hypothetical protein